MVCVPRISLVHNFDCDRVKPTADASKWSLSLVMPSSRSLDWHTALTDRSSREKSPSCLSKKLLLSAIFAILSDGHEYSPPHHNTESLHLARLEWRCVVLFPSSIGCFEWFPRNEKCLARRQCEIILIADRRLFSSCIWISREKFVFENEGIAFLVMFAKLEVYPIITRQVPGLVFPNCSLACKTSTS
jgi:hypothetical protein